jgi:ribulose-5-phosphate 4-epimerase/fuculose-1-phosphate aldolase
MHELREQVALGCRVLHDEGQREWVWGHVSARDPDGRGAWMKPAGLALEEVSPDDVLLVGWDGEVREGAGRRHQEWPIHTELLRARPDAGAVVHTHPPHAIALAASGRAPEPFSHVGGIFAGGLGRFEQTAGLVDTVALGAALAGSLGNARAVFLVKHGVATVGADVGIAVTTAVMLERACQLQLLVDSFGGQSTPYTQEQALHEYRHAQPDAHMRGAWAYMARRTTR